MSDPLSRYLGPEEAAQYLGLSPKTLQRMRVTGEGPPYVEGAAAGDLRPARSG